MGEDMYVWVPLYMTGRHVCQKRGARGFTDQSEASILYPPEYLGRMPHVRGVVWGPPLVEYSPFFFSGHYIFHTRDIAIRHVNVLKAYIQYSIPDTAMLGRYKMYNFYVCTNDGGNIHIVHIIMQ